MAQLGADVEQLDALATALRTQATGLETTRSRLTAMLAGVWWMGADGERMRAQWHTQHSPMLHTAVTALQDVAANVRAQAQQQRAASEASGMGGPANDGQAIVMTFNIGRGAGDIPGDGVDDEGATFAELSEVADEIVAGNADVVALQEVHEDDLPRLVELLERRGLHYDFEFQEALPADDPRLADNVDPTRRNPYGIAVLSVAPITPAGGGDLPFDGRENRVYQVVETDLDGATSTVVNTHIGREDSRSFLDVFFDEPSPQDAQTQDLFRTVDELNGPIVVTGDFNQSPRELADNARESGLDGAVDVASDRDVPTTDGGDTIDYVLVSPDITPGDAEVAPDGVSDHRSVYVEVEVPD